MKTILLCILSLVLLVSQAVVPNPAQAEAGSYTLSFKASNPQYYPRLLPSSLSCPGTSASTPLPGADASTNSVKSLAPSDLALGQIIPFQVVIETKGRTTPENGKIKFKGEWNTKTTNGEPFGFDGTRGIYCAFIDTGDSLHKDSGSTATLSFTQATESSTITGNFALQGLEDKDTIVVEVWLVLQSDIAQGTSGNVQSRLAEAQTDLGSRINTGSQTIPLLKTGGFFEKVNLKVQKSDAPDPVELLGSLLYTIEVTNESSTNLAQEVTLSDTLDPNVSFKSLTISDSEGEETLCQHDGSTSGGVITCQLFFLEPLESVKITVQTEVTPYARPGAGGAGPCTGIESLCNTVTIAALNDSTASVTTASQPTAVVIPGPYGSLIIDKLPNADVVYPTTTVTYLYEVSNGGTGPVGSITVTDDKCQPVTLVSGDANSNSLLDTTEKWNYECHSALTDDTLNIGKVVGIDVYSTIPLSSTNDAFVNVIRPALSVLKEVDLPVVTSGTTVTYSFTVANTGDDELHNVSIVDPHCTPLHISGDQDNDATLDLNEIWKFSCTAVISNDTVNTAYATASDSLRNRVTSDTSSVEVLVDNCPLDPSKSAPGVCGCGVTESDTDLDGTLDCHDTCSNDPLKTSPGVCGCGLADRDSDLDGTLDCNDECASDPNKTSAGVCGCGALETDSDNDGTPNCSDLCPIDPAKINVGVCGCGIADSDSDGDMILDCNDSCASDPAKSLPGLCGCGVPDDDTDTDGTPDCTDLCNSDPKKITGGVCGCGIADSDTDGDLTADCLDSCPADPSKIAPGVCGCNIADSDGDGDGTPDCLDLCPLDPSKVVAGVCGCGSSDIDSDKDGTSDCLDLCPSDPAKVAEGVCGCGIAETDADGDGTKDCRDLCPSDPFKISDGICGCGIAEVDTDGDGTKDCNDRCISDPFKLTPGTCGCDIPDTDSDGDGTANCLDLCVSDPNKVSGGVCGCGVADGDTDRDLTPDCLDSCPTNPSKIAPGVCGCNIADSDGDGDGTPDCLDLCPTDPMKVVAGACGCGISDADTDKDGASDCQDLCPVDPLKTAEGACGCGTADLDSDRDGTPDCKDQCAFDPAKLAPGSCGCGVADTDSDGDGTSDCNDLCTADPLKTSTGICGCGVSDTDSDGDGTADCKDLCPNDLPKISGGACGCGTSDLDSDGDGIANCRDLCPADSTKIAAGSCGCGVADSDTDGDGTPDCQDLCPSDSAKIKAGTCGCGVADTDSDGDGVADCSDLCQSDSTKSAAGICGCGVSDADTDGDGTADCNDLCVNDPAKVIAGVCGCGTLDTDSDKDGTADCNDQCSADPAKASPGTCGCGLTDTDSDKDGTLDCKDLCVSDSKKMSPGVCGCGVADTDANGNGLADCNEPLDCKGIAGGGAKVDRCGVCGGDGSSCVEITSCTPEPPSTRTTSAVRRVKLAARVLRDRTELFESKRKLCGGTFSKKSVKSAQKLLEDLNELLKERYLTSTLVCSNSICGQRSEGESLRTLRNIAQRLYTIQKSSKLNAIAACPKVPHRPDKRKRTEDYRDDLLRMISQLPVTVKQCTRP